MNSIVQFPTCNFTNFILIIIGGLDQPPAANSSGSPLHEAASIERSPSASPAHQVAAAGASNEKTVDNWEDADNSEKSGAGTGSATPDEEENSLGDNDGTYVPASKPRTKVKPKVE